MEAGNGLRERVTQAERRLDRSDDARSELWRELNKQGRDIVELRTELRGLSEDISQIREDSKTIREWVEGRIAKKDEDEQKKEELSITQKLALYSLAGLVIAAIITAIAQVVSSGAL
jgi:septal ring factor EnvC (AmiA/AmiB activator)